MKVSICIAAYNVAGFIEDCLNSIIEQTHQNFEVIIVNDGSTDDTESIIKNKINSDERFLLINTENEGVANARNIALKNSTGEYIIILDSDDYLDKECLQVAIDNISDSDILIFNYKKDDGFKITENKEFPQRCFDPSYGSVEGLAIEAIEIEPNPWGKLYKKNVFDNIEYPRGLYYEDYAVFYNILSGRKIKIIQDCLYFYRIRKGSIMRSFSRKHIDDKVKIMNKLKSDVCEDELSYHTHSKSYIDSYNFHLVFVTANIIFNSRDSIRDGVLYLNGFIDRNIFNYKNIISSNVLSKQVKFFLIAYLVSPRFSYLLKMFRKTLSRS